MACYGIFCSGQFRYVVCSNAGVFFRVSFNAQYFLHVVSSLIWKQTERVGIRLKEQNVSPPTPSLHSVAGALQPVQILMLSALHPGLKKTPALQAFHFF